MHAMDFKIAQANAIEQQIRPWHVAHTQLIECLHQEPRHLFLKGQETHAYIDQNLKLDLPLLLQASKQNNAPDVQIQNLEAKYLLTPKLEARLLQIVLEQLEQKMRKIYAEKQTGQHILKVVMLGADLGYIPHILNCLFAQKYYFGAIDDIDGFHQGTDISFELSLTIMDANPQILTLLSSNLHCQPLDLSSFKIMQHHPANKLAENHDLANTDLIFASASSPYLLPIYQQIFSSSPNHDATGIAFVGDDVLQYCQIYQYTNQELSKPEHVFETYIPAFANLPVMKRFVF